MPELPWPRLILSMNSMPETTSPNTVYLPFSELAREKQMKNCELALLGLLERAMPNVPRSNGARENSARISEYFEPPVPVATGLLCGDP